MRKAKVISGSIGLLLCAVLVYELIWGKLLPYSPIILGFRRQECPHVILYTEKDSPFGDYEWVDTLVSGVEQFHDLACKTKPKLFFFGDAGTYARRSPSKARLCAFYNGAVVVSPRVQREDSEGLLSLKVYLTHELSHSVLYQNMDTRRKFLYPRWLMEGVATYSANQMGTYLYPSREETYALIREGNWMPPEDYNTKKEDQVPLHVKNRKPFIYCEFACIASDLIARYGRDRFLVYLKKLLNENDHDAVFQETFDMNFSRYIAEFKARVVSPTE